MRINRTPIALLIYLLDTNLTKKKKYVFEKLIAIWNDELLQNDLENIFIPMSKNTAREGHNRQINPIQKQSAVAKIFHTACWKCGLC